MKVLRIIVLTLILIGLAMLLTNCEQNSGTGTSNTVPISNIGSITLTTESIQLFAVQGNAVTATVTATVTDTSGTAIKGVPVTFATPNIGSISVNSALTDSFGHVNVVFNSLGQFGLAHISAWVTGATSTITGYLDINVVPLTGLAHTISLTLSPTLTYVGANADSTIQATVRVYDSLNVGIPGMQVNLSTDLGVIAVANPTDNSGTTITYIHTDQDTGVGHVKAWVYTSLPDTANSIQWPGVDPTMKVTVPLPQTQSKSPEAPPFMTFNVYEISDTDTFWVLPMDMQINQIVVSANPGSLTLSANAVDTATVSAYVLDANNAGVAGVPVQFSTNLGVLSNGGMGITNSNGVAMVTYTTLPAPYGYGMSIIHAGVGTIGGNDTLFVESTPTQNGLLNLYTSTNIIYADGNITFAQMTAVLKDADNQVIQNAPVIFTANQGTITSPVNTDTTGQARANFYGLTIPSPQGDSAMVIAKYPPLGLADTVRVWIAPARAVDHVVLSSGSNYIQANGTDSTRVDATVYMENNELAPPGTEVNFNIIGSHGSHFTSSLSYVTTNGMASVYYIAGLSTGVDTVNAECESVFSNSVPITLHAGPPSIISIASDTTMLYVNSTTTATITAELRDTTGNMVGNNFPVSFSTSLGSITPPLAPTVNGVATAHLSASTTAGNATVKATFGALACSTLVQFVAQGPANITLSTNTPTITVQGGGSNNFAYISAHVIDAAGNAVQTPVMVHFRLIGTAVPPIGPNINGENRIEDSTTTNGGTATVVLNAGQQSGPVQIKAWTYNPSNPYSQIWAQQSLVTITAGPPAAIEIQPMSDPQDGGGDVWQVEVSAYVKDVYNNPVPDSVAVSYYLLPDTIGEIDGAGFTGNSSWTGLTEPGVAYTTLSYHSDETFDSVYVYAYCMVGDSMVLDSTLYHLPLADGQIWLTVEPIAWNYDYPPYGDPREDARMKCTAKLKDGHNRFINNAEITFFSSRGYFYTTQYVSPNQYPTTYEFTGPAGMVTTDPDGYATLWLITGIHQAFPEMSSTEVTGQVYVQVAQFPIVTSSTVAVTYTKNPG